MINKEFFNTLSNKKLFTFLFIYVFFLVLMCSHMSPLYFSNEWADVNIYFNIGKAIFNGKVPYTDVFDHKGPLIFFIYGFGYLISNGSFFGMFLIQFISWCVMLYFIFRLSELYLDKMYAYMVAIIMPIFVIKLMKAGGSAEEFILVFECISLFYFIRYFNNKELPQHKPAIMFLHGLLCSAVFFIKINLIIFWFFPLLVIFVNLLLKKEFRNFFLNAGAFLGGVLLIALPICAYFLANGALQDAYDIYIELNRKYANLQSFSDTMELLVRRLVYLFMDPFSLFFMGMIGIFYFPLKHIENTMGKWAILLAGVSLYVIIFMSPVFQVYYPLVFLVFSILGILSLFIYINRFVRIERHSLTCLIVLSFVLAYIGFGQKDLNEMKTANYLIKNNPGLLTQNLHDEIVKEENPTLMNLGFGLGNSLFTTCNIVPNIRYFVSPNFTYEEYPEMRDYQTKCIKEKRVDFILLPLPYIDKDASAASTKVQKRRNLSNHKYFLKLPALQENYELILTDTIVNSIDDYNIDIYKLYKIKK